MTEIEYQALRSQRNLGRRQSAEFQAEFARRNASEADKVREYLLSLPAVTRRRISANGTRIIEAAKARWRLYRTSTQGTPEHVTEWP